MTKQPAGGSSSKPPRFRFEQPQGRIDWATLDNLDISRLMRNTDLDALEALLPSIAHGSLRKYNSTDAAKSQSLRRLFEVSQLAVQYLLYVQDRLAADVKTAKRQLESSKAEVKALEADMAELRREAEVAEKEARHSRKMLRIALNQAQTASAAVPPAPVPQSVASPTPPLHAQPSASPPLEVLASPSTAQTSNKQAILGVFASPAPQNSQTKLSSDPEAAARLRKLEDTIAELLQWKQQGAQTQQAAPAPTATLPSSPAPVKIAAPISTASPKYDQTHIYSNNMYHETVDVSPRHTATAPPAPPSPHRARSEQREDINPLFNHMSRSTNEITSRQQNPTPPPAPAAARLQPPSTQQQWGFSSSHTATFSPSVAAVASDLLPSDTETPSPRSRLQFLREFPHEALGHERPGVRSRYPHPLGDFRQVRRELQAELESELAAELAAQGIDDAEGCTGLTPAQYLACMDGLRQKRAAAIAQMSSEDKERERFMRNTVAWHVEGVAKSVAGPVHTIAKKPSSTPPKPNQPAAASTHNFTASTPTGSAFPSPSTSMSPSPVDLALLDVKDQDTEAFYSPLRRGNSNAPPAAATHAGSEPSTPSTPHRHPPPSLI